LTKATHDGRGGRIIAATALGAAVGATAAAGNALLLYTGQGFLRAAGLLLSSTMLAIAAGVWAGAADEHAPPRSGGRWLMLVLALLLGGGLTVVWSARSELRELPIGGALAVLFILALPAYTAGAVLAALHARHRAHNGAGIAPAALGGAAVGVLLTTMLLIQNLDAFAIYHGAAGLLLLVGIAEARAQPLGSEAAYAFSGRVAIITGAGDRARLGFTLARRFLEAGARIVITDTLPAVEQIVAELSPASRVTAVRADLTQEDDVARVMAAASKRFGRLDALVNADETTLLDARNDALRNAPASALLHDDETALPAAIEGQNGDERLQHAQLKADVVLRTCQAALPLLRESRGAIVNFAAPATLRSDANGAVNYGADAAVIALTRALALEEETSGVRVNAIAVDDAGRASPDVDIASVAVFLAGPAAAAISGETIHVSPRP
jgi:NAD(P)-dependent dehydrogenase (short-subunit alcohol dehydrogenase family)